MANRHVPHEHRCSVCGSLIGCADAFCPQPLWVPACNEKRCEAIADKATVHLAPGGGSNKLGCCGKLPEETSRGDRMTLYEAEVTCKGGKLFPEPHEVGAVVEFER